MKTMVMILMTFLISGGLSGIDVKLIEGNIYDFQSGKALSGVKVSSLVSGNTAFSDQDGAFTILAAASNDTLYFSLPGYESHTVHLAGGRDYYSVLLNRKLHKTETEELSLDLMGQGTISYQSGVAYARNKKFGNSFGGVKPDFYPGNTEEYWPINENIFHDPRHQPLSTFSIDVDGASYSNVRRMINLGQVPPKDAVRIEEFINYFNYDYPDATGQHPFTIYREIGPAPWNDKHRLVHIGIKGKSLTDSETRPCNLVFLIDVSGSMSAQNKLPLVKSSLKLLTSQLNDDDRIAIVVYAGAAGLVLPSTPAKEKETIFQAINGLEAGGSTAGGAGIELAYSVARKNLDPEGNNRVILATDGDFNVGSSSTGAMVQLIEKERQSGIFLTVVGFGMGNYKDSRMEEISNAGNGNYYYVDNLNEAQKVFVHDLQGTLFTIASDVKIQVEFNPQLVGAYRLIGYENRMLQNEDFNNDEKDAGELGSGHTVTALYEIIPAGIYSALYSPVDSLKYQQSGIMPGVGSQDEWLTVKIRYKPENAGSSILLTETLIESATSNSIDFNFSAAVACFGMLLRDSPYKGGSSYDMTLDLARMSQGNDPFGYRRAFLSMVEHAKTLTQ
jgi:Ca-activated chloride channel family protein